MGPFEDNLTRFETTKYGSEMKDSLFRCFNLLFADLMFDNSRLNTIEKKIEDLEKKGGD